ncbi:QueG-associated DUF1730 domain-containing protein [Azotobacter sp. CWF10]
MDYSPEIDTEAQATLRRPGRAYVARYAAGPRHRKLMRSRLQKLATQINDEVGAAGLLRDVRRFPPRCWNALARNAGLGWIGRSTPA